MPTRSHPVLLETGAAASALVESSGRQEFGAYLLSALLTCLKYILQFGIQCSRRLFLNMFQLIATTIAIFLISHTLKFGIPCHRHLLLSMLIYDLIYGLLVIRSFVLQIFMAIFLKATLSLLTMTFLKAVVLANLMIVLHHFLMKMIFLREAPTQVPSTTSFPASTFSRNPTTAVSTRSSSATPAATSTARSSATLRSRGTAMTASSGSSDTGRVHRL